MAVAAIDEAVRNVVAVGGDPTQTAILDNFCWGRADDPRQLGALVRTCQACYDVAMAFGVPFISGKDSLNNEFALGAADVEPLLELFQQFALQEHVEAARLRQVLPELSARVRATQRLSIPGTLLISAVSIVADVRQCVTPDLKTAGDHLFLVGGCSQRGHSLHDAARVHELVSTATRRGLVAACHDCSDGGWLTAVAEMAIAGELGVRVSDQAILERAPFAEWCAAYIVETSDADRLRALAAEQTVPVVLLGEVLGEAFVACGVRRLAVNDLRGAWATR